MNYRRTSLPNVLITIVDIIIGIAVVGLVLRFFFRLFGANPSAEFVAGVYNSTSPLLNPFRGIFDAAVIEPGYVFEFSTLIAILSYILIGWFITELILILSHYTTERISRRSV